MIQAVKDLPQVKAAFLKMLYRVMKLLFDVLAGMLPCAEVDALRAAYDTFHNWETLKTTPQEEYPGRDIGLSAFEQYADQYDIRLHNKKQLLKNRAEGL